jgi:hypothetical protein
MAKSTVISMLCYRESLEAIKTSVESLLQQKDYADIAILDNSADPDVNAYLLEHADFFNGYHKIQNLMNFTNAFRKSLELSVSQNYKYFMVMRPGDTLSENHVMRCEQIMALLPSAEVLLFTDSPLLEVFHGKVIGNARQYLYKTIMMDHHATISQMFIRTDVPYGSCISPPTVEGISWVMLFSLCRFEVAIWNKDVPAHSGLPVNPFFELMGRYERLASLSQKQVKDSFIGVFSVCARQSLIAMANYAVELSGKLAEAGRIPEAENCWLFAPVAWEGIVSDCAFIELGRKLGYEMTDGVVGVEEKNEIYIA